MLVTEAPRRVVIIGGGIVGACCAYYLQREGAEVTIVDRGTFGGACSHANCGYISPSHVLPLAQPGAIRTAAKALLKPGGPFRIKPRFDPHLWSWLATFARRCNHADMMAAGRGLHSLLVSSRELYGKMIEQESLACQFQQHGLMFAFQTEKAMQRFGEEVDLVSRDFDMPADRFSGEELVELEPALKDGLAGAFLYRRDAHLRPDLLMQSLRSLLLSRGATIRENTPFDRFIGSQGRPVAAKLSGGEEVTADAFVVATGAWTPLLKEPLGVRLPIQAGKGYSITMPRPEPCPKHPMLLPEHKVGVTPFENGFRLGSMMEFAGYDDRIPPQRIGLLKHGASAYLRTPYREPIEQQWFGWRPMTPSGLPFIDFAPGKPNVVVAAGHCMLGLTNGAATGKLVSELLTGSEPHIDPRAYRIG
jgi:D-amino-acid dehydrogenase